eukprot:3665539-Amphidinium_carterae.1
MMRFGTCARKNRLARKKYSFAMDFALQLLFSYHRLKCTVDWGADGLGQTTSPFRSIVSSPTASPSCHGTIEAFIEVDDRDNRL